MGIPKYRGSSVVGELFGGASVVDAIVFPLGDVHIHAIAGFAEGDGEVISFAWGESLEVGGFRKIEVPAIHVDGDEVSIIDGLWNDESLVAVILFQRDDVGFLACGGHVACGEVDGSSSLELVHFHADVGSSEGRTGETIAWNKGNHHLAHDMFGIYLDGSLAWSHIERLTHQQVTSFVIGQVALVGLYAPRHRLDVGNR